MDRGVGFAGEGRTRVVAVGVESERDPGGGADVSVLRLRLRSFAAPMDARMESVLSSPSARDAAAVLARCAGVARKSQPPPALCAPARVPPAGATARPRRIAGCCAVGASSMRSDLAIVDSSASSKRSGESEVVSVYSWAPGQVQLLGTAPKGPLQEPVHPSERV